MTRAHRVLQVAAAGLIGGSCLAAFKPAVAADMLVLAPHRAVYDLTLSKSRGKRPIQMVRGRILYDFSGSACEGYALQFRQVSEIDNGEGKQALSDLRAATWEDGQGKSFRFNSENKIDNRVADTVNGSAERNTAGVAVKLTKPKTGIFDLDAKTAFPTEQIKRIIEAAEAGKSLLELPVYDGSETGDKVFQTLSVIGKVIAPGEKIRTMRPPATPHWPDSSAGPSPSAISNRAPPTRPANRRRSTPSASSSTKTAFRAP